MVSVAQAPADDEPPVGSVITSGNNDGDAWFSFEDSALPF